MKEPWNTPEGQEVWKTKAQFINYIRGGIRRGMWMRHPLKISYIHKQRIRVPLGKPNKGNPEGMVWGCKCEICQNDFKQNDVQVDHIIGNHKLTSAEDLQKYITSLVFCDHDDLQIVCKQCHKIKTHAERKGISFKEAMLDKLVIVFTQTSVEEQKQELRRLGLEGKDMSNSTKRKALFQTVVDKTLEERIRDVES